MEQNIKDNGRMAREMGKVREREERDYLFIVVLFIDYCFI